MRPLAIWLFIASILVDGSSSQSSISLEDDLLRVLKRGMFTQVYPGAVAATGSLSAGVTSVFEVGHHTYSPLSPRMSQATIFDLASLTKVMATTSAIALLVERGQLHLDSLVVDVLGEEFAQSDSRKEAITIRHCLTHTAGFPPDPSPWFWDDSFTCPNSTSPPTEDFTCLPTIYESILNQSVNTDPGETFLYSDFSFMTLQFVVGKILVSSGEFDISHMGNECRSTFSQHESISFSCAFEQYITQSIFNSVSFRLPQRLWRFAAPTLNDTVYTMRQPIQGQVSDGDAFAMGGVAGHAGLFSTLSGVTEFAQSMLASVKDQGGLLNQTTASVFTTQQDPSLSSRALGWDINTAAINDYGFDNVCGNLSDTTFLHIGYTGTCLCIDPVSEAFSVILTNRVFNCIGQVCPDGSESAVKSIYREFNQIFGASLVH